MGNEQNKEDSAQRIQTIADEICSIADELCAEHIENNQTITGEQK